MDTVITYLVNLIEKFGVSISLVVFGCWASVKIASFFAPRADKWFLSLIDERKKTLDDVHNLVETVRLTSVQNAQALSFLAKSYDDLVNYIRSNRIQLLKEIYEEKDSEEKDSEEKDSEEKKSMKIP